MSAPSLMYYNEVFGKTVPRRLQLVYEITGAVTVAARPLAAAPGTMPVFGAISTQAVINTFLGTTDEFNYLAFDSTSMGADAMGVIINMKGQAADLINFEARCYSNTGFADLVTRSALKSTALTNTTLVTECAVGASGNLALKINWGNTPDFDGLTSGMIVIDLNWIAR